MRSSAERIAACRAVVLRPSWRGRHLAPGRRRGPAAGELSALRRSAVRRVVDRRAVLHLEPPVRCPQRAAASFRQPAAQREAAPGALAERREVSLSARLRRAVCPVASSALRQREASRALLPEEQLSGTPLARESRSAVPSCWAAFPWGLRPAFPAHAWRQPEAARGAAERLAVSSLGWPRREAAAWVLRSAALLARCARAEPHSGEAAAVGSDARTVQPRAAPEASVRPPVVAGEEVSVATAVPLRAEAEVSVAAAVPLRAEGEVSAVAAVPQRAEGEVSVAAEEPQQAAAVVVSGAAAGRQPVAALSVAWRPAAGRPSAAPWVFRPVRALPSPVRRRAVQSAHAMFVSRAASRSERSWQAARCEGLS